jgi:hypothetical protein
MKDSSILLLCVVSLFGVSISRANADVLSPNYEVKFLLAPEKSLETGQDRLLDSVKHSFSMQETPETIHAIFLDTDAKTLDQEGWNIRLRHKENDTKNKLELTYKKRYPIASMSQEAIHQALEQARLQGFDDSSSKNYDAQVEYGYQKMTLSLSNNKTEPAQLNDGENLPSFDRIRNIMIGQIPGKLNNWTQSGWGKVELQQSRGYGPLYYKKYTGILDAATKMAIEVWPIRGKTPNTTEYIVEASFKANTFEEATQKRSILEQSLKNLGVFLPEDGLKTQTILQRY